MFFNWLAAPTAVFAEGHAQFGIGQNLLGFNGGADNLTNGSLFVDIQSAGEVINVSACGDTNDDDIRIRIYNPSGAQVVNTTLINANVDCNNDFLSPLAFPVRHTSAATGAYRVTIENLNPTGSRQELSRVDVTVTTSAFVLPDPTGLAASSHVGRLYSYEWTFDAGSFQQAAATDANYYMLTPGGRAGTNYVWQLDLNQFAGFVYEITANSLGVDSPNAAGDNVAGLSVPESGNSVTPLFPIYVNYPTIANPSPSAAPVISNFRFIDDAGQDGGFTPGDSVGVQDTGVFEFTTDVDGTYAISIDVNQNSVFGDPGDVLLLGVTAPGANQVVWDGRDNAGAVLPVGQYQAQLDVRLGEFHFVARDAETSGGPSDNGLTIYEGTGPSGLSPTLVYWDDLTFFSGDPDATATSPDGALSGTAAGYHTWGQFSSTGSNNFGDQKYIDTYVYGLSSLAWASAAIIDSDEPISDAIVSITPTSQPGDTLTLQVNDGDRNLDVALADTLTVSVVNDVTGELETISLTETGADTGVFTGTVATTFGASAGADNDGTFNTQGGDTVTVAYTDEFNTTGSPIDRTDTNSVSGGATGTVTITDPSSPGDTLTISVNDADLNNDGVLAETIIVSAVNGVTGETEAVTLTETGPNTGVFTGTVATIFGTTAGANNDGTFITQSGDTITVTYNDALTASGGTASPTDTSNVIGGVTGTVSITDPSTPGDTLAIQVDDGDLNANSGVAETISVPVANDATGETETVTLTETGPNTGIFAGTVATTFGTTAGADNDGTFNTQGGDTVTVTYNDALTANGGSASPTDTSNVSGGASGVVSITDPSSPGDTLTIQVDDADLNTNSGVAETVSVAVVNDVTGEVENVTLTETGADTGVFTGTVATTFGASAGANNDGSFNTQAGDTLTVTYDDALTASGGAASPTDTSNVNGGVTGTVSITDPSRPGETLTIQVNDADLNANAGVVETINVATVNAVTGEAETVTLTETGANTGVFTGAVATTFGASAGTDNDGSINAQAGDTITVAYDDALTASGGAASPTDTSNVNGGTTGTVSITDPSVPGDTLTIQVTDADLNNNGGVAETIAVSVVNDVTGEVETVTLTETGVNTGVFAGTVTTTFGAAAGADNDGTFNTQSGDTVTVTYGDALTANGGTASPTDTSNVGGGADGTISITDPSQPGDTLVVQVNDADFNENPGAADSMTVSVVNDVTGETETVTLTETGVNTGIFSANVSTSFGTSAGPNGDGAFNTQAGDTLTASYDDFTGAGETVSRSDTGNVTGGVTGTVSITASINPGDSLTISVNDADLNANPGVAETVTVSAVNDVTGEAETVTLTETGPNTGVFEVNVSTVFGTSAGTNNDGSFNVQNGDTVTATYSDALTAAGGTASPTAVAGVGGGFDGTVTITPSGNPGDTLTIQVTDADLNTDGGVAETITVTTVNDVTGETEIVTLTETGVSTGVFEGAVATAFGTAAGTDNDGILNAQSGDTVTVTYSDALTGAGGAATQTDTSNIGGGVNGTISLTPALNPGDPLNISVNDNDLNTDSGVAETIAVTVVNDVTGESETVTLTETGVNTGVFEADAPTVFGNGTGADNDGTFTVQNGHTLTGTYDDALTAAGGSATRTDTANVGGGADGTVTSSANVTPGDSIAIEVQDADLNADTGAVETITVTAVNSVTGETETVTLMETGPNTGVFQANLATTLGGSAGPDNNGVITIETGQSVVVTYNDALTAAGGTASTTATTSVDNIAPTAADDSAATQPGDAVSVPVLANDSDPEGQSLTVTGVTQGSNGSVAFMADGTVVYTPDAGFTGTDTFTYSISDGNGGVDTATVTVAVDNETPTAVADSGGTTPDTPVTIDVAANDTDPNGDPLTIDSVTQGANGSVVINPDGTVTYTPNAGFAGTDTFTYTICDGDGNCDTATVTVTVSADTPQAVDDVATTPSGTPATIDPADNDNEPNGQTLTVTDVTEPANGAAVLNPDGTVTYTPDENFVGTDTFTYTVCDPDGNCDTATITVTSTNQAPAATDDSASTQPEEAVSVPVLANDSDPESQPLRVTSVTQGANGTVTFMADGTVVYTSNAGFTGADAFTYTIDDGNGGTATANVTVTVDNETPTAVADSAGTLPDTQTTVDVLANDTDPNGDPLTVTGVAQPANGTVVVNPDDTVTYTPHAGFSGADNFTYTACDSDGNCDTATVTVTVSAEAPQAVDDVASVLSGTPSTIDPLANDNDPNGDPLTVADIADPANGTVVINPDGAITYTPEAGFVGTDTFTYTVCDDDGNCDTASITVTVGNQPPSAQDDSAATQPGNAVSIPALANDSDPENRPLTISSVTQGANGTVAFNPDGTVIYTPNAGFTGTDTFTYTVDDGEGAASTATITVVVDEETPTANADSATTTPGEPTVIDILGNDIDPNGDDLTVADIVQPANGAIAPNPDGTVTYSPNAGFEGADTFAYTVCDVDGNCDTATVSVSVDPNAPQANDDNIKGAPDTPVTFDPLANDTDPNGDPLTLASVSTPANGAVVVNPDGTLTYTPDSGFDSVDTFTYTVCDSTGACDTGVISVDMRGAASIEGIVFFDDNQDDVHQSNELLLAGYGVEILLDGEVVAATSTDENGFYRIDGLEPTDGYVVVFRNPDTGVVVGAVQGVALSAGETMVDLSLPVDPSGVIYNAETREPLADVTVVITDASGTPLPNVCLIDTSQQNQVTADDGFYRFDLVPGADPACPAGETEYRLSVTLSGGLPGLFGQFAPQTGPLDATTCPIDANTNPPCEVSASNSPPTIGEPPVFFIDFAIAGGDPDVINNHIPIDLAASQQPLTAFKTATVANASVGSLVPYTVTIRNDGAAPVNDVDIVDLTPAGFKYVEGSARLNGQPVEPVRDGLELTWADIDVPANGTATVTLVLIVGAGVDFGNFVNRGFAESDGGAPLSNIAEATVRIVPDAVFDCSEVIGKVFDDRDGDGYQDQGEPGLAGVRVATVNGLLITTDNHGRYHIACAATPKAGIGSNFILKLDPRTLPAGYRITTENPRVIRLTRGKMSKLNFGASLSRVVRVNLTDGAFAAGTDELAPAWAGKIEDLVAALEAQPSVLRLTYVGAEEGEPRLKAVARLIKQHWKEERGRYDLDIETRIVSASNGGEE
ncbi:Ig-like domain-containing protein [Hyphococcus sp.]|uniref:Ig-like domain-containing protein n=1 Tax=Hyphococcus sp. TaxID=2038636 RepID=UPI003CCBB784